MISIIPIDNQSLLVYNGSDLRKSQRDLAGLRTIAEQNDRAEANAAIAEIPRDCLGLGAQQFNATSTWAGWNRLVRDGAEMIESIDLMMDPFCESADQTAGLMTVTMPSWTALVDRLDVVQEKVPTLTIDGWLGDSGSGYRETLAPQANNVAQVRALAKNAEQAVQSIALLQAALSNYLMLAFNRAQADMPLDFFSADTSQFKGWTEPSQFYSYPFYWRTRFINHRLEFMRTELEKLRPTCPDWEGTAQGIGTNLDTATEQALAGSVPALPEYADSTTYYQDLSGKPSQMTDYDSTVVLDDQTIDRH